MKQDTAEALVLLHVMQLMDKRRDLAERQGVALSYDELASSVYERAAFDLKAALRAKRRWDETEGPIPLLELPENAPSVPVTAAVKGTGKYYILRDIAGALVGAFGDYGELEGRHFARLRVGTREVTAHGDTEMDAAELALSILVEDARVFMLRER